MLSVCRSLMGHENLGVIEEIGADASKAMVMRDHLLEVGERVTSAADIRCGKCYNCRNIYGFPWCLNHTSTETSLAATSRRTSLAGTRKRLTSSKNRCLSIPKNLSNEIALLAEQMAVAYGSLAGVTRVR